ncbi:MAG: hypothetical protein NTW21_22240 [Verrucomicrobia bacterium]|nr:hypothetical protein [Verrucomicrobiota bacterium]
MKPFIPYSLIAAALACGFASAQTTAYTTPVGYVTHTLVPGQYNLIGLTLQNPTAVAGVLTAETGGIPGSVSASAVNFDTALTAGKTYILELPDGTVQEITAWSGSTLTTPDDITAHVVPDTTTFALRPAATVSSIFGAANSAGLTPSPDGDLTNADAVLLSTPSGLLTIYYYNDGAGTEGWLTDTGDLAADIVIAYPDGLFVQRAGGSNINLVVSGEVKKVATSGVLASGYNYMCEVAPVGLTLDTSGLSAFITGSDSATTADNVLLPTTPAGSYVTCYFYDDGAGTTGWLTDTGDLAGELPLTPGFLIYNLGADKPVTVSVPAFYSTL